MNHTLRRQPIWAAALLLVLLALGASGCRTGYEMTLNNGVSVTSLTKPRLDKEEGAYHYKDAKGEWRHVPAFRVQSIEPR